MDTNPQAVPALPSDDIGLCRELKEPLVLLPHACMLCICFLHFWVSENNANLDHHIMTQMVVSDGEYALLTSLLIHALLQDNTYSELATMKAGALKYF